MSKLEIRSIETALLVRSFEGECSRDSEQVMTIYEEHTGKQVHRKRRVHLPFNPPQGYYYVTEKIDG